jgi:hypothetical protein
MQQLVVAKLEELSKRSKPGTMIPVPFYEDSHNACQAPVKHTHRAVF